MKVKTPFYYASVGLFKAMLVGMYLGLLFGFYAFFIEEHTVTRTLVGMEEEQKASGMYRYLYFTSEYYPQETVAVNVTKTYYDSVKPGFTYTYKGPLGDLLPGQKQAAALVVCVAAFVSTLVLICWLLFQLGKLWHRLAYVEKNEEDSGNEVNR